MLAVAVAVAGMAVIAATVVMAGIVATVDPRGYGGYGGNGYPFQDNSAAVASAYRTLGVTPDASDSEVKSAYKRLALRFHPDRYASAGREEQHSAEEQFKKVNEAYQVIKKKRGLD